MMIVHGLAVEAARRAGPVARVLVYMQIEICRANAKRYAEFVAERAKPRRLVQLPERRLVIAR